MATPTPVRHAWRALSGLLAIVVNLAWVVWTLVVIGGGTVPEPTQIFGMIAVIGAALLGLALAGARTAGAPVRPRLRRVGLIAVAACAVAA